MTFLISLGIYDNEKIHNLNMNSYLLIIMINHGQFIHKYFDAIQINAKNCYSDNCSVQNSSVYRFWTMKHQNQKFYSRLPNKIQLVNSPVKYSNYQSSTMLFNASIE